MKFIPLGDKHSEYNSFDDVPQDNDTGKPRKIPSYFDTAKKHKKNPASNT